VGHCLSPLTNSKFGISLSCLVLICDGAKEREKI
jgi:hypothetical protein